MGSLDGRQFPDLKVYREQGRRARRMSLDEIAADFKHLSRWYEHFLKGVLPRDRGAPVLDVPCGHGNFLFFLRSQGYTNIRGVDIEPGRIAVARDLGLPAAAGDALRVVQEASGVQMLVSLDFLEHLPFEESRSFVGAVYRALRPGGVFLARVPVTDSILGAHDFFNDPTHKWAANSTVLLQMFEAEGFTDISIRDERPVPYKPLNYVRLGFFYVSKSLTNLAFRCLGLPPFKIWSTSAWVIGRKQATD